MAAGAPVPQGDVMDNGGVWGWITTHLWAAWGIVALGLAAAEMLMLDFTLMMLAAGALAGAVVALIAPGLWWLQILVAIAVAILTLAIIRPTLLRRIRQLPGYRSSVDTLIGASGVATQAITGTSGEVRVSGDQWSARAFDASMTIKPGEPIEVYDREGLTLLVYPVTGTRELPR